MPGQASAGRMFRFGSARDNPRAGGLFLRECFALLGPQIVGVHAKDILLRPNLTVHLDEVRPGLGGLDYAVFLEEMAKLPGASLDAQVEEWRRVLTNLAEDFYHGDVRVRPKRYPLTCEHCGQRMLCRLDGAALEEDDDESATEKNCG